MAGTDDEWEFEYDQELTDTFLLDIDLSTINRGFKPTTLNRNKRLLDVNTEGSKPAKKTKKASGSTAPTEAGTGTADNPTEVASEEPAEPPADVDSTQGVQTEPADDEATLDQGFQVQGLHTENPLISYNGQVYSCTWTDLIGTSMFFSEPRETWLYDPDISTESFDLIGLSRIRLVGKEVKVTPIAPEPKTGQHYDSERLGFSLGTIRRANVKLNSDLRKQASFLEQLMNIKKNRGEKDNVHVVMNDKVSQSLDGGQFKAQMDSHGREIDELNKMVVQGDAKALKKLEAIYSAGVQRDLETRPAEEPRDERESMDLENEE